MAGPACAGLRIKRGLPGWSGPILNAQGTSREERWGAVCPDRAKTRNAIAVAESGRDGEVRYLGEIDNTPDAVARLVRKLSERYDPRPRRLGQRHRDQQLDRRRRQRLLPARPRRTVQQPVDPLGHEARLPPPDRRLAVAGLVLDRHRAALGIEVATPVSVALATRCAGRPSAVQVAPPSNVKRDQSNDFEFYLYVACYPHHCATIHKGLCHRRAGQRGGRLGPFRTKEAALEQANSLRGVRSIHLCERCKPECFAA